MTVSKPPPTAPDHCTRPQVQDAERLADALRANLAKRKAQQRRRQVTPTPVENSGKTRESP